MLWKTNVWAIAGLLVTLAGCGSDNGLITISGTVTLDGQPIENGSISLMPVSGNGIAGGGSIENGRYTAESSAGEMAVQINAIVEVRKENPTAEEVERGLDIDRQQILPAEYNRQSVLRIDVSRDNRTHNFSLNSDGS